MANVLDDDKSWQAFAFSIDEMLIVAARVDTDALHEISIVIIAFSANTAPSVNTDKSGFAIAL